MQPIKVRTPNVKGSGNRVGWCKVVTGIKGDDVQGEFAEGDTPIEMLPGDLLLVLQPIGYAKERTKKAILYAATDDAREPSGLKQLFVTTQWPEAKASVANIAAKLLARRKPPSSVTESPPIQMQNRCRSLLARTCQAAVMNAVAGGAEPEVVIAVLAEFAALACTENKTVVEILKAAIEEVSNSIDLVEEQVAGTR